MLGGPDFAAALVDFYARWKDEPLVVDKWFQVQAVDPADDTLERVKSLTGHPAFDADNPNRLRALVQTFATRNPARFHDPSGAGYQFLADQILAVDRVNPNVAAKLIEPLAAWNRYPEGLARACGRNCSASPRRQDCPRMCRNWPSKPSPERSGMASQARGNGAWTAIPRDASLGRR